MQHLLTDKNSVAKTLQVAIGYDSADFDMFIREAQVFDLKPMLPEKFYFDMLKNNQESNYALLINGGEYQFEDVTLSFSGIKKAIDYFSYARFVLNSGAVSTSHGFVVKATPNSTPLSLEERKNIHYKKISEAGLIMKEAIEFIERNINDYPKFREDSCGMNFNKSNFSTRIIK